MEISYIFQILTLLVSICILVLNILFSRIEKSREYLLENITKQRNYDMLKMREISAEICALTDVEIIEKKVCEVDYLEKLILDSKHIDFLLKRYHKEDREVIEVKDKLVNSVINYCNDREPRNILQIQKYNKLFNKIAELFNYTAWQCIKEQAIGKRITTTEFSTLYIKYRTQYLSLEDEMMLISVISNSAHF